MVIMKLLKVKSRNYNGMQYYKYRVNIPEQAIKDAGFEVGDELVANVKKGEIKLRKKWKMTKNKIISFWAKKTVTQPVKVKFVSEGKTVSFVAKKQITKPIKVEFKAKKW